MSAWLKIGAAAGAVALLAATGPGGAGAAPQASPWGTGPAQGPPQAVSDCQRVPTSQPPLPTDGTACCKFPRTWVKSCYEEYGKLGNFQCVYEYACVLPAKP